MYHTKKFHKIRKYNSNIIPDNSNIIPDNSNIIPDNSNIIPIIIEKSVLYNIIRVYNIIDVQYLKSYRN